MISLGQTLLGEYNTKYVISPYELNNESFSLEKTISGFFIYRNLLFAPRAYFQQEDIIPEAEAKILKHAPSLIKVDTTNANATKLVLSEVWSLGWNAYLNGTEKVIVQEKPNRLRLIDITASTRFVDFKYEPRSFKIGRIITIASILGLVLILAKRRSQIFN